MEKHGMNIALFSRFSRKKAGKTIAAVFFRHCSNVVQIFVKCGFYNGRVPEREKQIRGCLRPLERKES